MIAAFCALLPLFGGCDTYVQAVATPSSLLQTAVGAPARNVRVVGKVQKMIHHTSRSGLPYDVFFLCSDSCVRVYRRERTSLEDGDVISVVGTYYAERRLGRAVFRKELDAWEIVLERPH